MSDPLFDFTGRVAVVTGGMGRLGRAYACALAERGARVAVVDTVADAPAGDAAFVAHLAAGRVAAFPADITDRGAIEQAVDAVAAAWGVPHILVNNAASMRRPTRLFRRTARSRPIRPSRSTGSWPSTSRARCSAARPWAGAWRGKAAARS